MPAATTVPLATIAALPAATAVPTPAAVAVPVATVKPVTPVVTKATVAAATAEATAEATPEATAEATAEATVPSLKTNSTKNGNCDLLMPAYYVEYRSGNFVPMRSPNHSGSVQLNSAQPKNSQTDTAQSSFTVIYSILAGLYTLTTAASGGSGLCALPSMPKMPSAICCSPDQAHDRLLHAA